MAWTYFCESDNMTLVAQSKEELVDVLMLHVREDHDMHLTREQATESVEKNAKQAAA